MWPAPPYSPSPNRSTRVSSSFARLASSYEALEFSWIFKAVSCMAPEICWMLRAISSVVAVSSSEATAIWLISPVTLLISTSMVSFASGDYRNVR